MKIFNEMISREHEQVVFCHEKSVGLKAIIAIHSTALGPALGGCRMWKYDNEEQALEDVLRLSKSMTYKSAAAGLNLGGGKAVIIADSKTQKNEALLRAFGRFVHSLAGRYITAEDVGTTVRDMEWILDETDFVTGIPKTLGGFGDPSPVTAWGVFNGIKAGAKHIFGDCSLNGKTIAVQGLGQVGYHLLSHLRKENAKIVATDVDASIIKQTKEQFPEILIVDPNEIFDVNCDIFAPCALGGIINSQTIPRLKTKMIAGCANNVLRDEISDSEELFKRGMVYIPDFIISAGGIINVYNEIKGSSQEHAWKQAQEIFDIVYRILELSKNKQITPVSAANQIAEARIATISDIKKTRVGKRRFNAGSIIKI